MSSYYRMSVSISGFDETKIVNIKDAVGDFWEFDGNDSISLPGNKEYEKNLMFSAEGCVSGSDIEFAEELAKEIWKANGGYCKVSVQSIYLEDPPCETYDFDEKSYKEMMNE